MPLGIGVYEGKSGQVYISELNVGLLGMMFGDTNADVLEAMEHDPRALLERLRVAAEAAINNGQLRIDESRRLLDHLESSLRQTTYLQD